MHRHGYYMEEDELSKAYDARLMRRMFQFAKPYWALLLISVFFLLFITALDLALPFITKTAIDSFMTPAGRRITGDDEGLLEELRRQAALFELDSMFIIDMRKVESGTKYDLEKRDLLQEKYFILKRELVDDEVLEKLTRQGLVRFSGDYLLIEEEKTRGLSIGEKLALREQDLRGVYRLVLLFFGCLVVMFIFRYAQMYILQYAGQKVMFDMRMKLFAHLQKLNVSFFDKNPVGRLVTRVTNDVAVINEMFTNVIVSLFSDVFILLGVVGILFYLNWKLASVIMLVTPVLLVVTVAFRNRVRRAYRWVRVTVAKINAYLAENISGIRVIQLFVREGENARRFGIINRENYEAYMAQLLVFATFRPLIDLIYACAMALIIWYGGGRVIEQTLTFGALVAFLAYVEKFFQPIRDLSEKYNILQAAMASAERIFLLLDKKRELEVSTGAREARAVSGNVDFEHVWFAYDNENYVLKDISFSVAAGESLAIVGATGAGKTSLINLLLRFYEVQKGSIKLDGIDIKELHRNSLRRNIGVVLQDVFLFSGSIKRNIALSRDDIEDRELEEIARYVNADRFINRIPNGFAAEVKERGVALSQGEKQLLAFARALAYNPRVLILDEATSNVDSETEALIQDALARLMKKRTFIVIAHRLSTIERINNIIVLHKGRIVERGTHQELLAKKGYYHDLYRIQFRQNG
jgi:ATP-binding cassette subfamily B multidrug efflux pump